MEFIQALIDIRAPTVLMIGGFIFLLLGLVTFKKPIVLEVTPTNRKIAFSLGLILIIAGVVLLSLQFPAQLPEPAVTETSVPTEPQGLFISPVTPIQDTPLPDTPLPKPVSFFENDCISTDIWTPTYLSKSRKLEGNCWDLSGNGFRVTDGNLFIQVQNDPPVSGTMSMLVPQTGNIKFDLKIDIFTTGESNNLVFGIGTSEGWLTSGEFVFYRPTASKIYVVQGTSVLEYGNTISNYKLGSTDTLEFQLNATSFDIYLNGTIAASNLFLPDSPVFWIGFRFSEESKIAAIISNFSVQK